MLMLLVEGGAYFENLSFKLWTTKVRNEHDTWDWQKLYIAVYSGSVQSYTLFCY